MGAFITAVIVVVVVFIVIILTIFSPLIFDYLQNRRKQFIIQTKKATDLIKSNDRREILYTLETSKLISKRVRVSLEDRYNDLQSEEVFNDIEKITR